MPNPVPAVLRSAVIERARGRCEYCHKPQISFFPHEVDHVVALKHGGATITPLTPEGRATVFLLRLNDLERTQERAALKVGE